MQLLEMKIDNIDTIDFKELIDWKIMQNQRLAYVVKELKYILKF